MAWNRRFGKLGNLIGKMGLYFFQKSKLLQKTSNKTGTKRDQMHKTFDDEGAK